MTIPKDISAVLSPTEVKELLTRMKVATLLHKKATYREITKETGAGAATIARIAKHLQKRNNSRIGDIHSASKPLVTPTNHYSFGTNTTA